MAITYDVCVARDEEGSYTKQSQRDSLKLGYTVAFDVEVSDPTDPDFDPRIVGPFDVMAAPQLPRVNGTVYTTPSGQIIPYLICRDKRAKRDARRLSRWRVNTRWDSATDGNNQTEADNQPIDPPVNLTDITPREESKLGQDLERLYDDYSATPKPCRLPTGNKYPNDFEELRPTLILTITQYEPSITYEQMLERKFKCNEGVYRTKPRFSWFIQDVQATEVTVQLQAGPTLAALVTYTLEYTTRTDGWKDRRELVDTHFLSGVELKPFEDFTLSSFRTGLIQDNGAPKPGQTGAPDTETFETQQTIDFSSFLQV